MFELVMLPADPEIFLCITKSVRVTSKIKLFWKPHTSLLRKLCNMDEEISFWRAKMGQSGQMSVLPIHFVQIQVALVVVEVGKENICASMQLLNEVWQGILQLQLGCQ
jgi:hypothetical protein